jgi:hypothetical protein
MLPWYLAENFRRCRGACGCFIGPARCVVGGNKGRNVPVSLSVAVNVE